MNSEYLCFETKKQRGYILKQADKAGTAQASFWQLRFPSNLQQQTIFSKWSLIIPTHSAFKSCSCDFMLHQAQYASLHFSQPSETLLTHYSSSY